MSSRSVPTIIIGPKGLLRDSLASLLGNYSYRVTEAAETVEGMTKTPEQETRMVLLTVPSLDDAAAEAARVRHICPDCRIVALLDRVPDQSFGKFAHSAIDGCLPLDVSQEVLTAALDMVMAGAARVVVLDTASRATATPGGAAADGTEEPLSITGSEPAALSAPEQEAPSLVPKTLSGVPARTGHQTTSVPRTLSIARAVAAVSPTPARREARPATAPGAADPADPEMRAIFDLLSERERQIIGGLINGQPNKTIARVYGITESTVKVHMKAILRKVPCCSNRTQVAIWAIKHADALRERGIGDGLNA